MRCLETLEGASHIDHAPVRSQIEDKGQSDLERLQNVFDTILRIAEQHR